MIKLFNRHYGTERFFIMIFICMVTLIGLAVYGEVVHYRSEKAYIADTPVYTPGYLWSRLGDPALGGGEVVGLITSTDNTSVFMLLKNNPDAISFNAADYILYVKGHDSNLNNDPAMTTYVYGTTGYVGFYITDPRGFENKIYDVIVQNNSAAANAAGENNLADWAKYDSLNFRENNQIRLTLNFGANGIEKSSVMDDIRVDSAGAPLKLLSAMSVSIDGRGSDSAYDGDVAEAQATLESMMGDRMLIAQYADSLESQGVFVPDLPYYVINDSVDLVPNDFSSEKTFFTPDMVDSVSAGSGTSVMGGGSSGERKPQDSPGPDSPDEPIPSASAGGYLGATFIDSETSAEKPYYYLHTDYIPPGAVHFEWQGTPLYKGLITQIPNFASAGSGSVVDRFGEYAKWRDESKASYGDPFGAVTYSSWRNTSGNSVNMYSPDGSSSESRLASLCQKYTDAVNSYISNKNRYFEVLSRMLDEERNVWSVGDDLSSYNGSAEGNIYIYGQR